MVGLLVGPTIIKKPTVAGGCLGGVYPQCFGSLTGSARTFRVVVKAPAESKLAVLLHGNGARIGPAVGCGSDKLQLVRTHGQLTDEAVALVLSIDVDR